VQLRDGVKLLLNAESMKNGYKSLVLLMSGLDGANGIILVLKPNITIYMTMKIGQNRLDTV